MFIRGKYGIALLRPVDATLRIHHLLLMFIEIVDVLWQEFPVTCQENIPVDYQVRRSKAQANQITPFDGEVFGVEKHDDVMLDESSRIARLAASFAQKVFQRRKRAGQVRPFDRYPPEYCGKMHPEDCWEAQHQQASQHGEKGEGEMQQQDAVGGCAIDHLLLLSFLAVCHECGLFNNKQVNPRLCRGTRKV